MGCNQSQFLDKKVIIVGGGYAGTEAAKALDDKFQVTLIEPQDAQHHKMATLRAVVVPGWENRVRIPLDRLLARGRIVRDEVTRVEMNTVFMKSGQVLEADYIVLAHGQGAVLFPGNAMPGVLDSASFKSAAIEKQKVIARSKSILIVGGGPVGVELSGEIKSQYPEKTVTLVHSRPTLLNNSHPPVNPVATDRLAALLREKGVDLRLEVRTTDPFQVSNGDCFIEQQQTVHLSDGSSIEANLVVVATGTPKRDGNVLDVVDESNHVKVDSYLRVEGFQNVFCVGDANNHPETKLAYTACEQAKHVAKSIIFLAQGAAEKNNNKNKKKAIAEYKGMDSSGNSYGAMLVPFGPSAGVSAINTTILGNFMTSKIKGKGLFAGANFKKANASLPAVIAAAD